MERCERIPRDGRREDLAGLPGAVRRHDSAERVGPLELGIDLDGLRGCRRGGEDQDGDSFDSSILLGPRRATGVSGDPNDLYPCRAVRYYTSDLRGRLKGADMENAGAARRALED